MKTGAYFLCNDALIEMAIPFLNAFREHNPDLPLCLIPFRDDDIEQLRHLAKIYDYSIFPYPDVLAACDTIENRISPDDHRFRKLAMWEGDFDRFVYIDVDNIVLEELHSLFDLLNTYQFVVCDSNIPENIQWVWKDSPVLREKITAKQIAFAANTSFIISQKDALPLATVESKFSKIEDLVPHMELNCGEQPLLNYLITSSGKKATSVHELNRDGQSVGVGYWAGNSRSSENGAVIKRGGRLELQKSSDRIIFIHWSGLWHARPLDQFIYKCLRYCGIGRGKRRATRLWFPYKRLWLHYRHKTYCQNPKAPTQTRT